NDDLNFVAPLPSLSQEVSHWRLGQRAKLLKRLEAQSHLGTDATAREMSKLYQRAFQFVDSPKAAAAFRLDREPPKLRGRYGLNVFGQGRLLARRLVEAGVPMIMVCWPDRTEPEAFNNNGSIDKAPVPMWDMHGLPVGNTPIFPTLKNKALPPLDVAAS